MKMNRRLLASVLTGAIIFVIISIFAFLGVGSNIQNRLSDNLYGGKTALDAIVIIGIDDASLQEIGRWPWKRSVFADMIEKLSEADVVGIDVGFFERSEDDSGLIDAVDANDKVVLASEYISFSVLGDEVSGKHMLRPIAGASHGYINVVTDDDGITRRINMDISEEEDAFAYKVYSMYLGRELSLGADFLVNFVDGYRIYSFADVLAARVDMEEFKGKIVLIGATAPDLHDTYFVPTSKGSAMPGVQIHASAIQTMVTQDYLRYGGTWMTVLLILIACALVCAISHHLGIIKAAAACLAMMAGYIFVAIAFFDKGIVMNLIYVPLAIIAAYTGNVGVYYFVEKRELKKTCNAFSKYVSPEIIKEIMDDPKKLRLGGEKRDITVFFSDIRGFTSISERLAPEELVELLNEYLSEMTEIILENQGVVDKYMGDAIMAFWNAPLNQKEHAAMAAKSCLAMIARLRVLSMKWEKQGIPTLNIGIGLNTGHAVVGNMGSDKRFDYTAMGDTVNLGSRLEGLNKQYGTNIIISESTRKRLPDEFIVRELDRVMVKGKKDPTTIYELRGYKDNTDVQMIEGFEAALHLYYKGRWDEAAQGFKRIGDAPSKMFIERCECLKGGCVKDWRGVWEMKTK